MAAHDNLSPRQFGMPYEEARTMAKSRRDFRGQLMGIPEDRVRSSIETNMAIRDKPGGAASFLPEVHADYTARIRGAQNELDRRAAGRPAPKLRPIGE